MTWYLALADLHPDRARRARSGHRRGDRCRRPRSRATRRAGIGRSVGRSERGADGHARSRRRSSRSRLVSGEFQRHRRVPFRPRHRRRSSRRRRAASTSASRISPFATALTCSCTCRRTPTATPRARSSSASSRRPTARSATTCPPGLIQRTSRSAVIWCKQFSHLFATAPFERRLTGHRKPPKVGAMQRTGERVPSRPQMPWKRPWPERSSTQLGLLSRLTREHPTGSRRLPRGVSFSCTTTRT